MGQMQLFCFLQAVQSAALNSVVKKMKQAVKIRSFSNTILLWCY